MADRTDGLDAIDTADISVLMTEPIGWMLPCGCAGLKDLLQKIARVWGKNCSGIELIVMRDWELAAINREHRACHGPTNILSFPYGTPGAGIISGSMFLSADAVQRECLLYCQEPVAYCAQLLIHGMAHLAGWDHGQEMDALTEQATRFFESARS